ncbi:MAG: MFS transporter, partial [Anaerolineae bacterium]
MQNTLSPSFDFSRVGRRITVTLLAAQSFGSAGFIAANTVNTLAGAQLSGSPALAGVPPAIYQLGAALAAFGWGYGMERLGRRGALALGLMLGTVGAGLAAAALLVRSFLLFCLGLALLGAANSAMQLARFAAAEVYPPQARGRAISNVVLGGTVGA